MPTPPPPKDELSRLAARLVALGAIPIAVFCAAFALGRAALGTTQQGQAWTWMLALAVAVASVFVLARRTARILDGEVQVIRGAIRHASGGSGRADLPELDPPLEALKGEVLALATDFQAKEQRLQERLDNSRQQVFFLTTHDPLTGLANRKTLEERLESALASARSQGGTHALIYLDIDFLHRINDAFGHLAGDDLLRRIVPVLNGCLRDEELLARIGGDEFAVLIENCSADYALQAGLRIRDAVQAWPFDWSDHAFQVGVSAGVVAITRLTPGLSAIFNEADSACFAAKEQGRNRVVAFHEAQASQYMRQTSRGWLKRINDAIAGGAFTLLYQPIVSLAAGRDPAAPARAEALLRMSETGGELILPMSFIPVAERYDLMRTIDRWVIERAFADYKRLARDRGVDKPAEFSINLSGHTLSSPDFADIVRENLTRYGVPPGAICFEITETAAIANVERARASVEALRSLGVRFWLDDFGSGLSSFNYLKHFPVDGLKIDGLFVKGVARSYLDYAMVEAIQKIATTMGLASVAECVESEDIVKKLQSIGVSWGQGFHLGPPGPLDAVFDAGRRTP
ncbi:MAG: EAL domain-containing protein [Betaproteobacteria bacterium]|nr:EAL domain-containing protein [Betaproteobacteria bacterium]